MSGHRAPSNDQWRGFPPSSAGGDMGRGMYNPNNNQNKYMDEMPMEQNADSRDIKKKKERGMSRLRMRRGPGRSGKLTKSGLDMQSFFKTKICPYLLSVHLDSCRATVLRERSAPSPIVKRSSRMLQT